MTDYAKILENKYPNNQWNAPTDCTYDEIEWFDDDSDKPTQDELDSLADSVDLDLAVEEMTEEIETARQEFQYANITVTINNEEVEFKATLTAQTKFFNYLSTIDWDSTLSIQWRLSDDTTYIELDQASAESLRDALIAREFSAYEQESSYLTELNNCSTADEVDEITISFE